MKQTLKRKTKVLVVEDQASMQKLIGEYFRDSEFDITSSPSADEALKVLSSGGSQNGDGFQFASSGSEQPMAKNYTGHPEFDAVLTDIRMAGTDGLVFCRQIIELFPKLPVIVMTAYGSLETATEALRSGAFDFVTKPVEMEFLHAALTRATEHSRLRRKIEILESKNAGPDTFSALIGQSEVMLKLKDQLLRIVDSAAPVLLTGESGSGKEVVARWLHNESDRRQAPFIAVNCAALPPTLLESELFGHVKGAFTDARNDKLGLFIQANGGTFFLDEIGEMPIEVQPKLLRTLEQMTVRPVGGKTEQELDVRIIAATNRDLETAIEGKAFREDLFYRLNVLELCVPPLRQRGSDTLLLANYFLKQFNTPDKQVAGFTDVALKKLLAYDWPGNVRELRNVVERAHILTRQPEISVDLLPDKIVNHQPDQLVIGNIDEIATLEAMQKRYVRFVLERTGGNKTEAARLLDVDRKTLYRKLEES